jgi:PPOX class probable F420-dependent enzyme
MMIDTTTEFGARVEGRLRDERIGWLTTLGPDGTPQPSPIWFLWDGESFLIYSQPKQPKLRNIERNPKVALHLDSDGLGGNIVVITGEATIVQDVPPANEVREYLEKYRSYSAHSDEAARALSEVQAARHSPLTARSVSSKARGATSPGPLSGGPQLAWKCSMRQPFSSQKGARGNHGVLWQSSVADSLWPSEIRGGRYTGPGLAVSASGHGWAGGGAPRD